MNKKFLGKGKISVKKSVAVGYSLRNEGSENNKGCRGRRIKILPEKSDIIGQEDLLQRGKVVAVGPEARCKVGDTIIFNNDGFETVKIGDESFYYILDVDNFIYEIL